MPITAHEGCTMPEELIRLMNEIVDMKNRIKDLENSKNEQAVFNKEVTLKLEQILKNQEEQSIMLKELANKPAKRWDNLVGLIIAVIVGYIASRLGLQ